MQARDVDHAVVVWRVWDLNADAKHPDEDRGQLRGGHELVVGLEEASFGSELFEHSVHHFDEGTNDVYLLHDAADEGVLACELELVLLQGVVEGENVGVERNHLLIYDLVKLANAHSDDLELRFVLSNRKHYFCQHEGAFERVTILLFHTLNSHLLNSLQN